MALDGWFDSSENFMQQHHELTCSILQWAAGSQELQYSRWWCGLPLPKSLTENWRFSLSRQWASLYALLFQCSPLQDPPRKPSHLELEVMGWTEYRAENVSFFQIGRFGCQLLKSLNAFFYWITLLILLCLKENPTTNNQTIFKHWLHNAGS